MGAKDYGLTDHPTCSVCTHPQTEMIHRALARGESQSAVAKRYGLTYPMVHNHITKGHLGELVEIAHRDGRIARLADLMDATRATAEETLAILRAESGIKCPLCKRGGDRQIQLQAVDRLHRSIELAGRITGQISAGSVQQFLINLGVKNESELRSALREYRAGDEIDVLDAFEDALQLVMIAIRQKPELQARALERLGAPVFLESVGLLDANGNERRD